MNTVAYFVTGSEAQGLALPSSDHDSLTVFCAEKSYYFGLQREVVTSQKKDGGDDSLHYEFLKYCEQLWKGNSQFFNTLWYPPVYENGLFYVFRQEAKVMLRTQAPMRKYLGLANRRFQTGKEKGNKKDLAAAFTYFLMVDEYCRDSVLWVDRRGTEFFETEAAMKRGEYPVETCVGLVSLAERLATESYTKCTLPLEPDFDAFNELVAGTLEKMVKNGP